MHHELLLLVLAVTGVFSRCSQAPDPIDVQGETSVPTEDGGAGGEGGAETSTSTGDETSTSTGAGGEGGEAGAGGQGGAGGEGGAGGSGGEGGAAPLGVIGAPCLEAFECASLYCQKGPTAGVCTAPCATEADCPGAGLVCSSGHCYVECQEGDPQGKCPESFKCVSPGACQPATW